MEKIRFCFYCGKPFKIDTVDAKVRNRRYCCWQHSRLANRKRERKWIDDHPEVTKIYQRNRLKKNPLYNKERYYQERKLLINALGGKCVVCGETNLLWLQIDYKKGIDGYGWRHPRHFGFVMRNKKDFQILCANHHQEKTFKEKDVRFL
jgi:hypothetical protein